MFNKYSALLKGFLAIFVLTVWVDSGFSVRGGNSTNSSANEPTIPEYSYGLGYVPLEGEEESILPLFKTFPPPPSWDWRSATCNSVTGDWTTIAKSQGGCGSCWDFAAHGALEAIINIRNTNPNLDSDLSEQYILSCYSGGWGCGGSNAYRAYEYMYNNGGTIPETCFPYYANDGIPCSDKCASWQDLLVPISDYSGSSWPSRDAIKGMIYEHGPVCLAFWVYADFYTGSPSFDEDGIYQYDGVSEYRGGHQIVAIGYEDTPDNPDYDGYWICKNSWGSTWGPWNDGCFGIAYGECDIEMELVYADYDKPGETFVRGDVDASGEYALADGLFFLNYFFNSTPIPICMDACDVDDSGDLTLADGLWFLNYFFVTSPSIPPPSGSAPFDCGLDPTFDALVCGEFPPCGWPLRETKVAVSVPLLSVKQVPEKVVVNDAGVKDGEVVVPVELINGEDITGVDITLGYDASILEAEKVEGGEGYDYFVSYTADAGKVRIGIVPDLEMRDVIGAGERVIAEVVFKVKGSLSSDVKVTVERVDLYGRGVKQVKSEWIGGLVKAGAGLPKEFALSQNYPNPFNPTTLIKYALPMDCQVRLDVYNVVGQRVATLVNGCQKAGYKALTWNAKNLASGVYFYRITAGDFTSIRKMVFLR